MNLFSCELPKTTSNTSTDREEIVREKEQQVPDTLLKKRTLDNFVYFTEDIASLKKQSVFENKKIILFFGAEWCGPCKKYKNKTFLESDTYNYLQQNYLVKYLDVETDFDGIEFQQKFDIALLPTLLFFTKDFEEIDRIKGHLDGYTFLKRIKDINEGAK